MKTIVSSILFVLVSNSAFAADCTKTVLELAQANMDSKAKAYGFEGADVATSTLTLDKEGTDMKVYSVEAYIYKATYTVRVNVDSICGVNSVAIKEVTK